MHIVVVATTVIRVRTMIFHHSLKTFLEDNSKTWNEKKQYFAGLCEENKDIF